MILNKTTNLKKKRAVFEQIAKIENIIFSKDLLPVRWFQPWASYTPSSRNFLMLTDLPSLKSRGIHEHENAHALYTLIKKTLN